MSSEGKRPGLSLPAPLMQGNHPGCCHPRAGAHALQGELLGMGHPTAHTAHGRDAKARRGSRPGLAHTGSVSSFAMAKPGVSFPKA